MDERTTVMLLSQVSRQIISQYAPTVPPEQLGECAERVAEATWEALVVMMRRSFARGDSVIIDGVGVFTRSGETWSFSPSAPIARSGAMSLPPSEGREQVVRLALFYLSHGTALVESLPDDRLVSPPPSPSVAYEDAVHAEGGASMLVSGYLRRLSAYLRRVANRLSAERPELGVTEAHITYDDPPRRHAVDYAPQELDFDAFARAFSKLMWLYTVKARPSEEEERGESGPLTAAP